jgi:hypothetical protein
MTATHYVITALNFRDEHSARWTATPFFMCGLINGITVSSMLFHHTFGTELLFTDVT